MIQGVQVQAGFGAPDAPIVSKRPLAVRQGVGRGEVDDTGAYGKWMVEAVAGGGKSPVEAVRVAAGRRAGKTGVSEVSGKCTV